MDVFKKEEKFFSTEGQKKIQITDMAKLTHPRLALFPDGEYHSKTLKINLRPTEASETCYRKTGRRPLFSKTTRNTPKATPRQQAQAYFFAKKRFSRT